MPILASQEKVQETSTNSMIKALILQKGNSKFQTMYTLCDNQQAM
jgi:hypothetical protein